MDHTRLRTVRQLASRALSEAALRAHIAEARSNGLDAAIVRVKGRIFLDLDRFNAWFEARRMAA
ncbi:MAG: DNA-binding protein [Betaproteobacteria bacterium]